MADRTSVDCSGTFLGLCLLLFIAIKVAGHSLAAWSWWWIFIPIVPLIGLLIQRAGL